MSPRRTPARIAIIAVPVRTLFYRGLVLLMLTASASLLVLGKNNNDMLRYLRAGVTDILVPVVQALAAPVDSVRGAGMWLNDMLILRDENQRLKAENATLLRWQTAAVEMENENAKLRDLLKFAPALHESYTSARVAVDASGPFGRAVIVSAGEREGVAQDLAVVNDAGLVGRVIDTGETSARVLLLTDINSRIPVMTETSRERAIAAGDNSNLLSLQYLPDDSKVKVGEKIVTTSDGGVLPPGLAVGVVTQTEGGRMQVKPLVDWQRLEYVTIVDFKK